MTRLSRYKPPDLYDDSAYDSTLSPEPYAKVDLSEEEKEQILAYLRDPDMHPEDMVMEAVLWFDRGVFDDYPSDILQRILETIQELEFQKIADELVKNGYRLLDSVPGRPSSKL